MKKRPDLCKKSEAKNMKIKKGKKKICENEAVAVVILVILECITFMSILNKNRSK